MNETPGYARDPFEAYVHIPFQDTNLALCGTMTAGRTNVMGAKVCLGCVEVELERELRRVQELLYRHGKGGMTWQ
jgi:hypothetical protein